MASLTIRKLDETLKAQLRLRAARNGRSVEDEVRFILRDAASDRPTPPAATDGAPHRARRAASAARQVTLIIGGGIAAYKALDLIRRLKDRHMHVRCVLTRAAQQFVTPLAASALADERCYTDLFDPQSEFDAGHIRLARDCDLIVVAPATADLMAKMANGHADDLATAILLATDRPLLLAPAMNPLMWANAATRRNVAILAERGVHFVGPNSGAMAEAGEAGVGRMSEPAEIAATAEQLLEPETTGPLRNATLLVTAGPTHEAIDPVRYIANRSSGKQGYAIAAAAAAAGAKVRLISGPVDLPDPAGVDVTRVESARDMLAQVQAALPVDCAIFAAAVADWRVADTGAQKIKKQAGATPSLTLVENPDLLATVARLASGRPRLVIGFAAETENLIANAQAKLQRKGCDWIVANDVSPEGGVMGGDRNTVHIVTRDNVESWPAMDKDDVATALVARVATALTET
ncbi:bifunctional phosphopantothenoylcysteine decarboxylase/phosphopantothenate--cysteine ligase CoaBC [Bradyrhizobium sp. LHD-71]|uniref:bifunctional phosphopantothenoylcysteine decarboxylase/phosphopantothenate--cysteine ligase CoaBC n=1 Tax=Bradyrhizobium sp. LHD-71 TaxID=3072141 RepID=UPI00280EB561|nr:bifunctional phosphopantothenoylcysteine decarboxylase/phosphopantothenate--cysteine ligase CoaBC [Bradyrhizobium sp. LHD-71]MDQ8731926.1 bifunctional phosphopantothenoylcysteine decarboxylase/phosphopantothenate--cysteine ligase CoaBC [Bradyrhizobium sp. LHD-71]